MSNLEGQVAEISWDERGLVPVVVQDALTNRVLMLAYMNADALARTLQSGETWFWSRSRRKLWHKGATSGNTQRIVELHYDCDGDTLLVRVNPRGPACHTGQTSCFYRRLPGSPSVLSAPSTGSVLSAPSAGSALSAPSADTGHGVADALARRGILVRSFSQPRMRRHLRIGVGRPEQNEKLIEALSALSADWSCEG